MEKSSSRKPPSELCPIVWRELPYELFRRVRQQSDLRSWTAIDCADVWCRRETAEGQKPAINRVRKLLRYLWESSDQQQKPKVCLVFSEETVRLWLKDPIRRGECTWSLSSTQRTIVEVNRDHVNTVLGMVVPLVRRAEDRREEWNIDLHMAPTHQLLSSYNRILSYASPKFTSPPELQDFLQNGSFLRRLELLLQLLVRVGNKESLLEYRLLDLMVTIRHRASDTFDVGRHALNGKTMQSMGFDAVIDSAREDARACRRVWWLRLDKVEGWDMSRGRSTIASFSPPFWDSDTPL